MRKFAGVALIALVVSGSAAYAGDPGKDFGDWITNSAPCGNEPSGDDIMKARVGWMAMGGSAGDFARGGAGHHGRSSMFFRVRGRSRPA
jgi:hypothetical protein